MENHVFGWIRVLDLGFLMRSPDSESGRLFEYAFGCVQVFDAQPTPAPYTTLENVLPPIDVPITRGDECHLAWRRCLTIPCAIVPKHSLEFPEPLKRRSLSCE